MTHELKVLPEYYDKVEEGSKNFELRKDDRGFEIDDRLVLREWNPVDGYTGRKQIRYIAYILKNVPQYGLKKGYVILGMHLFN